MTRRFVSYRQRLAVAAVFAGTLCSSLPCAQPPGGQSGPPPGGRGGGPDDQGGPGGPPPGGPDSGPGGQGGPGGPGGGPGGPGGPGGGPPGMQKIRELDQQTSKKIEAVLTAEQRQAVPA